MSFVAFYSPHQQFHAQLTVLTIELPLLKQLVWFLSLFLTPTPPLSFLLLCVGFCIIFYLVLKVVFFHLIKCIGVTLVYKTIEVSSVQLSKTSSAHCIVRLSPKFSLSLSISSPLPTSSSPNPVPLAVTTRTLPVNLHSKEGSVPSSFSSFKAVLDLLGPDFPK